VAALGGDGSIEGLALLTVLMDAVVAGSGERGRFMEPEAVHSVALMGDTDAEMGIGRVRWTRGRRESAAMRER
jgi:hypothetical protein